MRLAEAAEEEDSGGEEGGSGEGHEEDGVAVGGLGAGWGLAEIVLALGAALGSDGCGAEERESEKDGGEERRAVGFAEAHPPHPSRQNTSAGDPESRETKAR